MTNEESSETLCEQKYYQRFVGCISICMLCFYSSLLLCFYSVLLTLLVCSPFMFLLGVPLFFASCNFNVTTFCPRYNLFTGTVYMIKINGVEYTEDNPPSFYRRLTHLRYENDTTYITDTTQPTYKTYERYDYRNVVYYATHNDEYTCRVTSGQILSSSMDIGKNVTWYSFKSDPTTCDPETMVVRRWYVGFVFLLCVALCVSYICVYICGSRTQIKVGNMLGERSLSYVDFVEPDDNQRQPSLTTTQI